MTMMVVSYLESIGWLAFPHTQKWHKNRLTEATDLNPVVSTSRLAENNYNSHHWLQHGK